MINTLEADLTLIRKAFNQRILYFRQLQEISDCKNSTFVILIYLINSFAKLLSAVVDVDMEETVQNLIEACNTEERDLEAKVATGRARQRYLVHLSKKGSDNQEKPDEDEGIS